MSRGQRGRWRWSNVPVPESHVAGLLVGTVVHVLKPLRLLGNQRLARSAGWGLTGIGLLIIGWAVRTVGGSELGGERPAVLVTTGPYAFSRNPMYVGWTALYLGIALLLNTAWLLVVLPVVLSTVHLVVRREERSLEREFEDAYRAYRRDVRRYL
ncbi:methyltransferase family protein [Natronosalvus halobius]|uniref:methyltransferase family protein n=1 Tax=Natronosalvus halobius TaxID=2953746 RepID=UPI0020A118E1|nr:isoprenylcysteine carboxylmethyltransferase family protein [Natronosalvus halobius]USZ71695.1 isoprenylcysteine carboxylmethyltransferase family protein [Natronosalvus halobius]